MYEDIQVIFTSVWNAVSSARLRFYIFYHTFLQSHSINNTYLKNIQV